MKGTKRKEVATLFIISILITFCLGMSVSFAFFSAQTSTTPQTITFGKLGLTATDSNASATGAIKIQGTDLGVGSEILVDGQIKLESNSVDAYIRMRPNVVITADTSKTLDDTAKKDFTDKIVGAFFSINKSWLKSTSVSDDFYYCADRLTGGEAYTGWITSSGWAVMSVKESNFKGTIKIEELGSSWQGASVTISFDLQAIQAKGTVDISGWTTSTTTQEKVNAISSSSGWGVFNQATIDKLNFTGITDSAGKTTSYSVKAKDSSVSGDVIIPSYYNKLPVTEIGNNAFGSCSGISTLTIPTTIKSISASAFFNNGVCAINKIIYLGTADVLKNYVQTTKPSGFCEMTIYCVGTGEEVPLTCYQDPNKCFVAGTQITLSDGSYKNIEEMQVGDYVKAYDEISGQFVNAKVLETHKNLVSMKMIIVKFDDGTQTEMTAGHPLYGIKEMQWLSYTDKKGYGKLCVGSEIMALNGSKKVVSIEEYEGKDIYVYNLTIESKEGQNCHNYFANNTLAHNATILC